MRRQYALIRGGVVVTVAETNGMPGEAEWLATVTSQHDAVVEVTAVIPQPSPNWTYAAGVFAAFVPRIVVPAPVGAEGLVFQTQDGPTFRWVYVVGDLVLPVADATATTTAQPSTAAIRAYVRANVDETAILATIASLTARADRVKAALTAAGVDPLTNARYARITGLIASLGAML